MHEDVGMRASDFGSQPDTAIKRLRQLGGRNCAFAAPVSMIHKLNLLI